MMALLHPYDPDVTRNPGLLEVQSRVMSTSAWGGMLADFCARGKPAPAGSKTGFIVGKEGGRQHVAIVDACKATKPWQQEVKNAAFEAFELPQYGGPVGIAMTFFLDRPKWHYGAGGIKASAPMFPDKRPDALKLARAVEDAITGVVFKDDAQIVDEHIYKRFSRDDSPQGVRVLVWKIRTRKTGAIGA